MISKKSKLVDGLLLVSSTIMALILSILLFMGIEYLQQKIFLTKDCIFFTLKSPASYLVFIFEVEIIILIFALLNKYRKSILWQWAVDIYNFTRKYLVALATFNVILLYLSLTNVVVVTSDKIINHTCFNPLGTVYSYDDAVDVNMGFYDDKISFLGNKQDTFYYKVKFKDNRVIKFQDAISKYDDTCK